MKKLLISILIILLIVLMYFLMFKNVTIGSWESQSFKNIKKLNDNLVEDIKVAQQINNQDYPETIEGLNSSMKNLKITKEKYKTKTATIAENVELGVVEIKQYKIERLWITLEQYAKDRNVELILDLVESNSSAVNKTGATLYDLNITLVGNYIDITDFVYDIEKDDTLDFKILNFKLTPNVLAAVQTTNTDETKKSENSDNDKKTTIYTVSGGLKATFKIEGVGIELK